MGLKLYYKENDQFYEISTNALDGLDPLSSVHDGKKGSCLTRQLYLRNDDFSKWFSNIIIKPVDLVDASPYGEIIYSETGWGIKLSPETSEPSTQEWNDIDWGAQITLADIGSDSVADTTSYIPFWHLENCPPNTEAQVKTDIVVNVSYTENAVS
jgi:hypothetical protein